MNLFTILIIVGALLVLHFFRLPFLGWIFVWPLAVYCLVRFGITPIVPASVLKVYLWLTVLALLVYLFTDSERLATVKRQCTTFLTEKKFSPLLWTVVVTLPVLLAGQVYFSMKREIRGATFGRTVHPPPPNEITFKGKTINLLTVKNPFRELETSDPIKFQEHVNQGKDIYFKNCVYCHGDDLAGDGIYAHGFSPVPANFNSETTIPMLQESYLFWRIAHGGPGLPDESGPWSSSIPQWEKFLSEEEIWNVILYLYSYTGFKPRAEEEHHQ